MNSKVLLLSSLVILTAVLIAVLYQDKVPEDLSGQAPKGEPPGFPEAPPPAPPPPPPTPTVVDKPSEPPPVQSAEAVASRTVDFKTRVLFNGEAVSGAAVMLLKVPVDEEGNRIPMNSIFHFLANRVAIGANLTDQTGELPQKFSYYASPLNSPRTFVSVAAFHPEYGSDYYEIPVEELTDASIVEMEIEKGSTIRGRVVFPDGKPAERALVKMYGGHPIDGVGLTGIGSITDENGNFSFSGVRFDNRPGQLFVAHPVATAEELRDEKAMEALQAVERRMMFHIPDSAYKEEASLYEVGTVTLVNNL